MACSSKLRGLIVVVSLLMLNACAAVRRNGNGGGTGGGSSIIASIKGLPEGERKLLVAPKYLLSCDSGEKIEGKVDNENDPNSIRFDIPGLVSDYDKKTCGLQISANSPTIEELARFEFKWFSFPAPLDSDPTRVFYASNRPNGSGGVFNVTLYKLYSRIDRNEPLFLQPVAIRFPQSATVPNPTQVSANLQCEGVDTAVTSGMTVSIDPAKKNEAQVVFSLGVDRYKGKACQRLSLAVAGEVKFEAGLSKVVLPTAPVAGVASAPLGPFDLVVATGSSISVNPLDTVDCLYFDLSQNKCLDKRDPVTLPNSQNFWLALVSGKGSGGGKSEILVSGPNGLGPDTLAEHKQISYALIKADLEAQPSLRKLTYFLPQLRTNILNAAFDASLINPRTLADKKMSVSDLVDFKVFSVDEVWVHGMNRVTDDVLNKETSARWFAMVKATKDTQVAEFIVTGGADYFYSDIRRGGTVDKPVFFDWEAVKTDRNTVGTTGETDYYDIYAFTNGALLPAGCVTPREFYIEGVSGKTLTDFPPVIPGNGGTDDRLEKCEVRNFGKDFDDFKIEAAFYEWNWAKVSP